MQTKNENRAYFVFEYRKTKNELLFAPAYVNDFHDLFSGYHGARCELEYNECLSSPCLNRGTCLDRVDNYECRCTHGHKGRNCELKVM